MTKKQIINFFSHTYCRIKASKIHGVGVCAVVPIPKGVNLFPDCSCDLKEEIKIIDKKEISHLDINIKDMLDDFFISTDTHYFVLNSLNNINVSYFLNHSDDPNCEWKEEDDSFRPLKDIGKGEELTLNYDKYLESELIKNV